ncbi:F-box only protein 34 [Sceloporus undulatus]|uniref:F-box only protein 34 n=1 Tax=Sceloporus undulatus TaxID=8520 RepID=UPI001C4DBD61|nr:F-box only protein 34 [Sceloporus undulatus]XP_042320575.1 F-box only protein 34 [Sceloporus undulatus]XP_042320583.1 F-box only protein 34 [Sceloporus undulatus]XP_042320593.1 F-box only protein 34 [Sceloporus undulatus]
MMKSSCRAGLHRELLNSTASTFHPVKRISGMHLKPYLKLQKKERSLDISLDLPRTPLMSQQRGSNEEEPDRASSSLFPSPSLRKPLGSLSPNTLCNRNNSQSHAEGPSIKERRAAQPATIHQGDDGEAPLDIWAVVKPGNTKEKVAFFAAQQCNDNRVSSMKNKSSWDIDGRATKRRKKSLDIKKAKIHLERMRETSGRCYQPEPFACSVEHCSVHNVNEVGEGGFPGRPLSVVEMVAFLEQRTSVLLASCTKNCPSASAMIRFPGQPKAVAPSAPGSFPALGADEAPSEEVPCRGGGSSGDGGPQAEPVRVLEMVAKLESQCLRRQSEREAGSLSRNNSFRRNVGRMLLVSGTAPESSADNASVGILHQEEHGGKEGDEPWKLKHSSPTEDSVWEGPSAGQPSLSASAPRVANDLQLDQGDPDTSGSWCDPQNITGPPLPSTYPAVAQACPHSLCSNNAAFHYTPQEPITLSDSNPNIHMRESITIRISAARTDKGCSKSQRSSSSFGEDTLPGRLFLLFSECEITQEHLQLEEVVPTEECQTDEQEREPHTVNCISGEFPELSSEESALQTLGSSALKRQRSHDFLETRFKIQQLLEPQQYLAFLPHHIIVKIFGLLPTRSLVALKCTCGYFKFIIEYYNIRPADSRWVRDPRYREDPCKQCKKKYSRGDVSLCRWHPKPYCQALPYGPGYWMCCHRSQKSVPGCKLGLHDNHWVPACHSFNRALHKKSREGEEDC